MAGDDHKTYHPKDALASTINTTMITGGVGLLVASVQNTLTKQNVGAFGVFTKFGGTFATFAAMGGAYEFVRTASGNLRQKNDSINEALGGLAAGSIIGLRIRTVPAVVGYGVALSALLGVFDFAGASMSGYKVDPNEDEFERKERLRKNYRRPVEETIAELGEGRGIYGPGYAERRAQRIKENYGIDVPASS